MKSSHPEVDNAPRVQPGEALRQERESQGLALEAVATKLNLTVQAVRLLEQGEFSRLPGHTFARGYVRAYARFLGLDADRLVTEFDTYTGTNASGSPVASLQRVPSPTRSSQGMLKIFSVVALLGLGAGGFFWWQEQGHSLAANVTQLGIDQVEVEAADGTLEIHPLSEPEVQAPIVVADIVPLDLEGAVVAEAVTVLETPTTPDGAPVVAQTELQQNQVAVESALSQAPAETTLAVEPVTVTEVVLPPLAAGDAQLNLQFTADCWTQVTDANGNVLLSALKYRGDSVELVGKAPLQVRLGYARGAKVLLNGKSVDLEPFTHGETARLTLGQ